MKEKKNEKYFFSDFVLSPTIYLFGSMCITMGFGIKKSKWKKYENESNMCWAGKPIFGSQKISPRRKQSKPYKWSKKKFPSNPPTETPQWKRDSIIRSYQNAISCLLVMVRE